VLQAGLDVLKAEGYAGLTTAKVAARSGQNKALIGYHFGSKQGLVAAVGRELAESITEVATKLEGQIKPLYDYINKQQGLSSGGEHASTTSRAQANYRLALIGLLVTVVIGAVGIIFALKG